MALVERVRLLQEELVALVNEQTGRTLFVLTVVTVLALPLTIVPGFFGMNVGGLPFRDHPHGFWMVVGRRRLGGRVRGLLRARPARPLTAPVMQFWDKLSNP